MNASRKSVEALFMKSVSSIVKVLLFAAVLQSSLGNAQSSQSPSSEASSASWRSDSVVYVAGLADIKPEAKGSLSLTPDALDFVTKASHGEIPFDRITAVFIGDERVATGGAAGRVARLLPYGVGPVMAVVSNKKEDLLTIEYLDRNGGHHGAVFEVPKTQAVLAQQQLVSRIVAIPVTESHPCSGLGLPDAILVEPIAATDVELPAEYRVLLYEQLVDQLRVSNGAGTVYRTGDTAAPCAAKKLQLTVTAFKKGNEAVRAATGPVGFFVGTTSVGFHVSVVDGSGTVLFERSLKENKHGDGDSLSVARDLAKSVSKRLAKAEKSDTRTASKATL
jgi:hypothetical protein